jgi:AcrR family transcriptional regulator
VPSTSKPKPKTPATPVVPRASTRGRPARAPTPNHVRRQKTESAVLASAEQLFVHRGFHRTTVDDIAHAAGLTKGAVYVHFKDKRDVLLVLLRRAEDRVLFPILRRLEDPVVGPLDKLVDYVHGWARVAIEQRETMFLPILMSFEFLGTRDPIEKFVDGMYHRTYEALAKVIDSGRREGLFVDIGSGREHAAVLVAFMDGLLLEWLRRGVDLDGPQLTRVARTMMLQGLVRQPARGG